jgi:hypothetical protein
MSLVERSIILNTSSSNVWNVLNDLQHTPDWVVGLERTENITPGPVGVGTIYHDINRIGPLLQRTPWTITEFEPMSRQVHVSESSVLPSTMILTITPEGAGVRFEQIVEYRFLPQLGPLSRLLEKAVMNRLLKLAFKQIQANLKTYIEQQQSTVNEQLEWWATRP